MLPGAWYSNLINLVGTTKAVSLLLDIVQVFLGGLLLLLVSIASFSVQAAAAAATPDSRMRC